jgi:hypothetical protein
MNDKDIRSSYIERQNVK